MRVDQEGKKKKKIEVKKRERKSEREKGRKEEKMPSRIHLSLLHFYLQGQSQVHQTGESGTIDDSLFSLTISKSGGAPLTPKNSWSRP